MNELGRVLALDLGKKRIGMALSDELGITAQGLPTLERRNKRSDFAALASLVRENNVRLIVLGLPLRLSGEEGSQADWVRAFGEELRGHVNVPVDLRDERWTSKQAERVLMGSGIRNEDRKPAIDRISAVILLQDYLDSRGIHS
ncbi:MAG TPA: Holliday junction resolvase RuvX [Bryobacteraceae bacterium]|jgi:putative Holliday junction resolvase